ncbi:globin [uncultured Serratia sp.]|uniref:globin n=1 Tax=uncultured Serratia sp. TaxID=239175 RepID=UPI00258698EC|nr:globin [uncultured Serratia sp.]
MPVSASKKPSKKFNRCVQFWTVRNALLLQLQTVQNSPPISPKNFAALQRLEKQKIIYKTFFYMLSVANTHIVADYLVQVTQEGSPQGLNLPPSIYALWRKAVLQTVRDLDPECDEEILTAWAIVLAPGLEFMRRQAELHHNPAAQSGLPG